MTEGYTYRALDPGGERYTEVWHPRPEDPVLTCPRCQCGVLIPLRSSLSERVLCWTCQGCRFLVPPDELDRLTEQSARPVSRGQVLELLAEDQERGQRGAGGGGGKMRRRRPVRGCHGPPRYDDLEKVKVKAEASVVLSLRVPAHQAQALDARASRLGLTRTELLQSAIAADICRELTE